MIQNYYIIELESMILIKYNFRLNILEKSFSMKQFAFLIKTVCYFKNILPLILKSI